MSEIDAPFDMITLLGPSRERLPNRREAVAAKLSFDYGAGGDTRQEIAVHVHHGLRRDGAVKEIFLRPTGNVKIGSRLERELDDVATLISLLLQHGHKPGDLARRLGRLGQYPVVAAAGTVAEKRPVGPPATLYGAVLDRAAEIEIDETAARGVATGYP